MSALNKYKNNIAQKRDYFGGLPKWMKRKSPVNQRLTGLCCGERGIRTPGTSQYAGFQDRCIRPLCHLSMGCWNPVDVVLLHVATHSVVLLICGCKGNAFYLFHQFFSLVFCDNFNIFSIFPCFLFKRSPFAVQNESFCIVKGVLLQSKCSPFAVQKESF